MTEPVLQLSSVTAGYGPMHVLRGIDLTVGRGERLAIIGRNGAGKTTLMKTVMGLTRQHGGSIHAFGQPIDRLAPFQRSALGLGIVPQTRDIFASLTVHENLLAAQVAGTPVEMAYDLFPRLAERRSNGGTQLSGGEQQMLAIARTLMAAPQVLLLDEPLEGLAPVICDHLMATFERLSQQGIAIVLVEQHARLALAFAQRAVLMVNGGITYNGPSQGLQDDPAILDRAIGVGR